MTETTLNSVQDAPPYSRPPSPGPRPTQIGFIGLGSMGFLMARNLAVHRASHHPGSPPLLVWNRTVEKSEMLAQVLDPNTVRLAENPGQIAVLCDVIITNLANDVAVKSIYGEFKQALAVCIT